jgi:NADH dehydrogenase (ubiquinone) 1 alpha subcomplex subunit 9
MMQQRGMALATYQGRGGRASVSGIQATVFGATGFLGRPTVNKLGRMGSQILVPYRGDEHDTRHLKVMGDYGQIVMVPYHIRDQDSVSHTLKEANVVVNLMGQQWPSFNFTLEQANVEGVRAIAEAAKAQGVERFIHVSAMSASADSGSDFAKSKAAGEAVVREIYPDATILRPGSMYGQEDRFLCRIAGQVKAAPVTPLINGGTAMRSPVYVDDVAEAIGVCLRDSSTVGKTYELSGPKAYSVEEVYNMIFASIKKEPFTVSTKSDMAPEFVNNLAFKVMSLAGRVQQYLPTSPMTETEIALSLEDELLSEGALTFADLGIEPVALEEKIDKLLLRFKPVEISAKDAGVLL